MADAAFEPVTPDELNEMGTAGFSDDEVHSFRIKSMQDMADNGFKKDEIEKFYGTAEPDMKGTKSIIKTNLAAAKDAEKPNPDRGPVDVSVPQLPADGVFDALTAGWGASFEGLAINKRRADYVLPQDASRAMRIAAQVGQVAGDLPAMAAGWAGGMMAGAPVGGAIGSVVPGVGTLAGIAAGSAIGAVAGAFAAPAAMRKAMMGHYEKGDIQTFGEFWDRSSAVLLEASKAGAVGAATGGAALLAAPLGAIGVVASEIGTMVTVGKAIEGEMPNADDFIDGAIMVGGLHAVAKVGGKLRNIYEKTGIKPEQVSEKVEKDPVMKQEILSDNVPLPAALEKSVDPMAAKADAEFAKETAPKEEPVRTEAETKILDKIGVRAEKTKEGYSASKAYTDFVDKLNPIKVMEEQAIGKSESTALPVESSPYKLARLANDFKAKAMHVIERGTLDFKTLLKNGKGLAEIIEPHMKDLDGFRAFLAADRAIEIEASGRKSGFDVDAAKQVVKDGKKNIRSRR